MFWFLLIIGILLLVGILFVLWRWLGQPIAYRGLLLTDTDRFLKSFLVQSGARSIFDLERESGAGFLQFIIVERKSEQFQVEFGLPEAEWSRKHFDLVHSAMTDAGYKNSVEENPDNMDIPRFLRVYIQGKRDDLDFTLPKVLQLAADQLGFKRDDRYTLRMSGNFSPEYRRELANKLEQLPQANRVSSMITTRLIRLAKTERYW